MNIEPIGFITSCYKEKFGIPRQPGLVPLGTATLTLVNEYNHPDSVRGLDSFSHVWLLFGFHATAKQGWKALVRPPRLGGNERIGVFASRSMFRPNGMGLSVCKLESISDNRALDIITLNFSGIDLLDNTPVYDIKPYIAYADAVQNTSGSYASEKPTVKHTIVFTEKAKYQCAQEQDKHNTNYLELITQILEQDPRPAFHQDSERKGGSRGSSRTYAIKLFDLDIKWSVEKQVVKVLSLW